MFDPAAMATLLIGLDLADQGEAQSDRQRLRVAARRREHAGIRVALARGLRRAASVLDRPTVSEVAN